MSKPLVFIVDDDAELNKVIERRFILFGADVLCFSSANDLYKAYDQRKPKLILVDLNLGDGLSGFDIIRTLRREKRSDATILILSGETDTSQIAHGIELGANDYIVKPPFRTDFEEILGRHFKAEHLPEPIVGVFQPVNRQKCQAKFSFPLTIAAVQLAGFTLVSDHLVRKGASFHLNGPELKKIIPSCEQVFVTVIGSTAKTVENGKVYQLFVEIDATQELALNEIKHFLDQKFAAQLGD